jgi:transposase-like protein
MVNRRTGFCENCNSNVVHVRVFQRRLIYRLDRLTGSYFGRLGFGPWQCVDCGHRRMRLLPVQPSARTVSEKAENDDVSHSVGNFIRTDQSLAHAASDKYRFSDKYRRGIVEKLLQGQTTVSRTCQDLDVSELEIQQWIREYLQHELDRVARASGGSLIVPDASGSSSPEPVNWSPEETDGPVIDSTAVRKPR